MFTFVLNLLLVEYICYYTPSASFQIRDHFSKYNDISFPLSLRRETAAKVKSMFDFGFDNYMKYAFPHDELKPKSGLFTDSLPELGNAKNTNKQYRGLALTLIDSLDSLLLFNRTDDFIAAHRYLSTALQGKKNDSSARIFPGFDIDLRVHVFETTIRMLGGLLSAHALTTHPKWKNVFFGSSAAEFLASYDDEFLSLARDLGSRLLRAFSTSNSIPFAWINLRHGVLSGETRDTCTAGVGTLLLEMSLLSYFTRNSSYFIGAHRALLSLWRMRSVHNNLLGNSFCGRTLRWLNSNAGIGAGIDSFYEYLLKSYIYLGHSHYWDIFQISYASITKYLRRGSWYIETNIATSKAAHFHFNSLQSFWPSIQILIGDIPLSLSTINSFFSIWYAYHGLPERFLLNSNQAHATENHYPLRPELIESIFYAKQYHESTAKDYYLWLGLEMLNDIENRSKSAFGYTILDNVVSGDKGDYMPSYFLAETVQYLLLLFDEDNALHSMQNEYIFTTEGHIFPMYAGLRPYIEEIILWSEGLDEGDSVPIPYAQYDADIDSADIKTKRRQDIIDSADIESIFIFQDSHAAVCPASPFAVYSSMHQLQDGEVHHRATDMFEEGMSHHWDWIHKMFGKKNEIYHNKKQISTVISNDGSIQIGDECPAAVMPPDPEESTRDNKGEKKEWVVSKNDRIRISHDIGHFTIDFVDHTEKLQIFNLGTNWIEMSNSVPIHSPYSHFSSYLSGGNEYATEYDKLNDVSIGYLFDTVGPTRYEIRLNSVQLMQCYEDTISDLLRINRRATSSIHSIAISLSSSYFRHVPRAMNVNQLNDSCEVSRVLASAPLIAAESPSNACTFPTNFAQMIEDGANGRYIVLIDRGDCTFSNKVRVLEDPNASELIGAVIVGNVVDTSNGHIFTMGSDTDKKQNQNGLSAFMMNKLSYHALTQCAAQTQDTQAEIVEVLTRCQKEDVADLNVHGINSHFAISTKSNTDFVVQQTDDIFRLSIPH